VHSAASRARLAAQHPGASVVQADLYDGRDVAALLDGVAVVLHVGPTYHPHETEIGYLMVDAAVREARRGAFKHFVLSSVLNSQLRKMMNKGTEEVDLRTRDAAQRMLLFYNYRGLIGNPNVLNWLIGRKPLSYADWVDMRVKEEESKES